MAKATIVRDKAQSAKSARTVKPNCILNNTQYTHFDRVKGINSIE